MYIKNISVENFRNYEKEDIALCPLTNVFYGDNAQGKTNLLEAVYLFSHGRSHRARSDAELIRFGADMFYARVDFFSDERDNIAEMRCSKDKKKLVKINNVPIKKLSMLLSYLNVVMFSPEDLDMIKGAPSGRRHFMDTAISQLYPNYLSNLIKYHKALLEKNSLLKTARNKGGDIIPVLSVWNDRLAEYGSVIYKYRRDFIKKTDMIAKPIHNDIAKEQFGISYIPGIKLEDEAKDIKESFFAAFERMNKREIENGTAIAGIQRDDIRITINGREARVFGSQGQQRTCVLTLKMAENEYIKEVRGEYPVLLLDDIMSELDINRRGYLWERITDKQVLMTCTDTDLIKSTANTKLFKVTGGRVETR